MSWCLQAQSQVGRKIFKKAKRSKINLNYKWNFGDNMHPDVVVMVR